MEWVREQDTIAAFLLKLEEMRAREVGLKVGAAEVDTAGLR